VVTPEQSSALAAASMALTTRIQTLQKAIEDHRPREELHLQLEQARGLHEALSEVLAKAPGVDPRAVEAAARLGDFLDGLQRTMDAEDSQ
jgi:hypothetical protein